MTIAKIYVLEDNDDICSLYRRELAALISAWIRLEPSLNLPMPLQESISDLCILDLSLPDGDALSTLRNLVAKYACPPSLSVAEARLLTKY